MERSGAPGRGNVKKTHFPSERAGIWITHADGRQEFLGWTERTEEKHGANVPLDVYLTTGIVLSIVKFPIRAFDRALPLPAPPPEPELADGSQPPAGDVHQRATVDLGFDLSDGSRRPL